MAGINGTVSWGIQPLDWNNSNLAGSFWDYRGNYLKSANDPLRYQVLWTDWELMKEQSLLLLIDSSLQW